MHRQQWRSTLATYVYPVLGNLPVAAIDTGLVVQVLSLIWQTKPETAKRVHGRIEAVLDAAAVRGWRDSPNPAQWKGNLAHILPPRGKVRKVKHHAALPYGEAAAFLAELRTREGMAARALEFTVLTAALTAIATRGAGAQLDNTPYPQYAPPAARGISGRRRSKPLYNGRSGRVDGRERPAGDIACRSNGTKGRDPRSPIR
ncbi:MAG: tyrosine-type recombinase/integrase [Stellaceae bacterium]